MRHVTDDRAPELKIAPPGIFLIATHIKKKKHTPNFFLGVFDAVAVVIIFVAFFQGGRRQRFFRRTQAKRYCHTAVIFRPLVVLSFLAVTTLAEAVKPNYGGMFSAVMQYGVNFYGGKRFIVFRR